MRRIWTLWKAFAAWIGEWQTRIVLVLVYLLVLPWFSFLRLRDPLGRRRRPGAATYWEPWRREPDTVDRHVHPF